MDVLVVSAHPRVVAARARARALDAETLHEQLAVVRIPAPPLQEADRARFVEARFREHELADVGTDAVGNVRARLPGCAEPDAAPVIVSAHLDTVFPAGTDLTPRHEGARLYAPGITDNARGVAALLTVARVLRESGIRTARPLWFVATVGEEGIGDLRGVKHLFREEGRFRGAAAFIALDGSGLRRIVHRAIGSRRLRATVRGPGGHSWSDWGAPNPVHALGSAIVRLTELPSVGDGVTLTVARIGGGTGVNTIPAEAWMEIDVRGERADVLQRTNDAARAVLRAAVRAENERRRAGSAVLTLDLTRIGDRPSGAIADTDPLVRAAVDATSAVRARAQLAASSTDANVPIALGIPAVTVGAGGESGGIHTEGEWYSNREAARGVERALLLALAAADLAAD
ncbi:MAG TPA: M20/M25/M40 family metallo-hydrolase [Longimicrobiaceae bacterium]|nr:M20/M25/M40 family metallo-hydrolase [Longimicrobiaceae bacterium]